MVLQGGGCKLEGKNKDDAKQKGQSEQRPGGRTQHGVDAAESCWNMRAEARWQELGLQEPPTGWPRSRRQLGCPCGPARC